MISKLLAEAARAAAFLDRDEERALIAKSQAGDQAARDKIVLAHTRLAIAAAVKFRHYGVPAEDLAQEAVIGLIEAIKGFDLDQPSRFSTYARWWIRARITKTVARGGAVRSPEHPAAKTLFYNLRTERAKLERSGELRPSEIVDALARRFAVEPALIEFMSAQLDGGAASLDAPLSDADGSSTRLDLLVDDSPGQDERLQEDDAGEHASAMLATALATLSDRERAIIKARIYVDDEDAQTLETLGRRFGITKERVRQIEAAGLHKLKAALAKQGMTAMPFAA